MKYALNPALVASTYAAYRPDVMLVDGFPAGRTGELRGILPNDSRRVFIYQERPDRSRNDPSFRRDLGFYGLILAPYLENEVEIPAPENVPVHWTGHIISRSRDEVPPREEARRRLGLPGHGFAVYVGFGGGGDPRYRRLLEMVLKQTSRFPDWTFACAVPPLYKGDMPSLAAENVRPFTYFPVDEIFSAFDAAISHAGNLSISGLLYHGIPSIFLTPLPKIDDDQKSRAMRVAEAGAGWIAMSEKGFLDCLGEFSDPAARERVAAKARKLVGENGAERAAEFLLDWVSSGPPKKVP